MDRDRNAAGRPRSARPRDGLGRPLAPGSAGVPREPEGIERGPAAALTEAQRLLTAGRPFHAHEVLEAAWRAAPPAETGLWRGLTQLAVGVTHLLRGNQVGADRLLTRGAATLEPLTDAAPHDVDVAALVAWARAPSGSAVPPLRRPT